MVNGENNELILQYSTLNYGQHLHSELMWLSEVISIRANNEEVVPKAPTVKVIDEESHYMQFILKYQLDTYDRLLLILTMTPYILPSVFKDLFPENHTPKPIQFREGGAISKSGRSFMPTIETFLYLACGDDVQQRIHLLQRITKDYFLFKNGVLVLDNNERTSTSLLNRTIHLSEEYYFSLLLQKTFHPDFSTDFPAKRLNTNLKWEDLVLSSPTLTQINEIKYWLELTQEIGEKGKLGRRITNGFKSLFYGSPGTGKTITAALLGNALQRDVYSIDLSMVVSKYIGETEKNLAKVFDMAERKNWILFFDEADALFGQRTQVSSSNDRYANQEVSYLLQRIESFNGLVILSSNYKDNIDHAFLRRFNSIIHFPKPKEAERLKLWKLTIPEDTILSDDLDLEVIAKKYNLTGAHIENVVLHALMKMHGEKMGVLNRAIIHSSIAQELMKENLTV